MKILGPVFATALLGMLVAGCNGSVTMGGSDSLSDSSSSSSVEVMVDSLSSSPAMMDASSSSSDPADGMPAASAHEYADGTYSATGEYTAPSGPESVDVTLTLKNDVITDATFKGNATKPRSIMFQGKFAEGFKEAVVGKSIDQLSLSVVNGSSLTPQGFMDAVQKIETQAKVAA